MIYKSGIFLIIFIVILSAIQSIAKSNSFADVTIIRSDAQSLVFDWRPQDFKLETIDIDNKTYSVPSFGFGSLRSVPGAPQIPQRVLTIGIPEGSQISVRILNTESQQISADPLAPVPAVFRDKNGVTTYDYQIDAAEYAKPVEFLQTGIPSQFRDIPTQEIIITPVQYHQAVGAIEVITKMRVQIDYNPVKVQPAKFQKRGKLDQYYPDLILNFDQAQNWQLPRRKSGLAKAVSLPGGAYYRIPVTEDGLYKISASTIQSAGIQLSSLNMNAIQMFNNGGHELSYDVTDAYYNPPYTQEVPILVRDVNGNGNFDSNDYILFYGKSVNSWFFNPASKDFDFRQHPYAAKNYYLLKLNGNSGKRMPVEEVSTQAGATAVDFFYDRFHFEEDTYNLLASGPDWYGHRFFGLSDSYSKSFDIVTNNAASANPKFFIQLKGGAGIKYSDDLPYRYNFIVTLNNNVLFSNISLATSALLNSPKTISDPALLKNGSNTLNIQYTGNLDACAAYVDYFELFYPRSFATNNNYLNFYTNGISTPKRYTITGLSAVSDLYLFDVSDPVNPKILKANAAASGSQLSFDLPALSENKNLIVASLASTAIKNVASLEAYQAPQDLISANNQADFLIVTHKSFVPYAEQIAELRSHLKSKVVTMEDIYFNFNGGVPDPTALRNFIRYAYNNWQGDPVSYVLLFGDGHYDYRNIALPDTQRVPPFEIYNPTEIDSRTTDNYYVDLNYSGNSYFNSVSPYLAIGRLPMESTQDAERMVEKLISYQNQPNRDGWQTTITFVGDDEITTRSSNEWIHQSQTEELARLSVLNKFIMNKVYLSAYPSVPGGFGRVKPAANQALIDYFNQGTLIINYVGHGSPVQWAHEAVFNMSRDLNRIVNPDKLPLLIAATCDFGKYDDPIEPSFTEALMWQKNAGTIGALASTRLVYSGDNYRFNKNFYLYLFPGGKPSIPLGVAKLLATSSIVNDQKYHLFADPTMTLADPRSEIRLTSITPDTLKALSQVEVTAEIKNGNESFTNFNGGAVMIVNDASYDSVNTGGTLYYTLSGPTLFKGELSVENGELEGKFIVPKSIRYYNKPIGRITLFAWSDDNQNSAIGYNNSLYFIGSTNITDSEGPAVDIYFQDQENFSPGDLISQNPVLVAAIQDENGINMTGETGHTISIQIDENTPKDISGFFFYEKNSFRNGYITYPLDRLEPGGHTLKLSVFDNLNNPSEAATNFKIAEAEGLILMNVANYPNPFRPRSEHTVFTFEYQTAGSDAEVEIKIYTLTGRLIQKLDGYYISGTGYREIEWDGRDRDGDDIANGVYLYKITLNDGSNKKEVIEKLVIIN